MTWDTIVDLDQALTNCHTDLIRDWYFDPWGWPELDWVVHERPEIAYRRLNAHGARPVAKLDVAKENFSIRPAVVLDPVDRLIYQALVDCISRRVIGDLSTSVFGWRLPPGGDEPGSYARNDYQFENFRSRLTYLANSREAALKTDIVSCFASIPVDRLADGLHQRAGTGLVVERILELLEQWDSVDGRSGLPQRSLASCVLANFYLQPLDEVLMAFAPEPAERMRSWGQEGRAARWMDDIWLFDDDAGRLRRMQLELQKQMEAIGLRMNVGKTEVIEGREGLVAAALDLQHSAVEADLDGAKTLVPLNDLIGQLLVRPEVASRTSIRFVTTRMRRHQLFDRVEDFAEGARRMPHASDGLARLFRDSGLWHDLDDWFVEYEQSDWGAVDWAVGQFGRMFPSNERPSDGLVDHLAERIVGGASLAFAALACQRLGHWDRNKLRDALRERRQLAVHPLERRVLGLAALEIEDDAWLIRELLSEYEENAVTLTMIDDRDFAPIRSKPDFAGE